MVIDHIRRFSKANHRFLERVCSSLLKHQIDTFWMYTLSSSGYMTYLGNQSNAAEYFFENQLFKNHPSFKSPKHLKPGYLIGKADKGFSHKQQMMKEEFSLDQVFLIGEKEEGLFRGFGFGSTRATKDLSNFYINHLPLFHEFIEFFLLEANSLITKANENPAHISPLIGIGFESDVQPTLLTNNEKRKSLLSHQESRCMDWLITGRSAKAIAQKMGISHRTVEHHIEHIKDKWGCTTKQELIELYEE